MALSEKAKQLAGIYASRICGVLEEGISKQAADIMAPGILKLMEEFAEDCAVEIFAGLPESAKIRASGLLYPPCTCEHAPHLHTSRTANGIHRGCNVWIMVQQRVCGCRYEAPPELASPHGKPNGGITSGEMGPGSDG